MLTAKQLPRGGNYIIIQAVVHSTNAASQTSKHENSATLRAGQWSLGLHVD